MLMRNIRERPKALNYHEVLKGKKHLLVVALVVATT